MLFNWLSKLGRRPATTVAEEVRPPEPRSFDDILHGVDAIMNQHDQHRRLFLSIRPFGQTTFEIDEVDQLISSATSIRHDRFTDWRKPLDDLQDAGLLEYSILGAKVTITRTDLSRPVQEAWRSRSGTPSPQVA